ncbi:MAG: hypothetical protein Q9M08_08010 [Mariprofundus sp.]|nr:hypothetical protein [Mariprofundus sp.]
MGKAVDTNTTKETDQDAIDAVIADSASATTPDDMQTEKSGQSHGGRNFILVLLLIVVAVLGALSLSGQLMPLYESLITRLNNTSEQKHPSPAKTTATPVKSGSANTEISAPVVKPVPVVKTPPAIAHQAVVSPEDVRKLLSSIETLHNELRQMENARRALQNGLKEQQQMNLQVRLRWIGDPASRLPQLQLTWEEISLLPGLSDSERQEAASMHILARNRVQQIKQWQSALKKWIDALSTPMHQNILPEPKYPWLAWVLEQFQLRQAPSLEARHLDALRAQLLDVSRQLTLESWPENGPWQSLQAELLLQIKAMQHTHANDSGIVETGLPENFDGIQSDIRRLRKTALQWSHHHRSGAWQKGGEQ